MKLRTIKPLAAPAALALTTPAFALPDDPAEMRQIIATEFAGDARAYVEENEGDFRVMGCRGRTDLLQTLLDDGLDLNGLSYSTHWWAFYCAFSKKEKDAMNLLITPDLVAAHEAANEGKRYSEHLLMYAINWDNYDQVKIWLDNGVHAWVHSEDYLPLSREEHLLLAAHQAVDDKKEDAIRAFQDAGFGHLIEAARNEPNVEYVRARAGQTGGGGGGLFRGLATMAAGRALGGTQGAILETMAKRSLSNDAIGDDEAVANGPLPLPTGRTELGAQLDLTRQPQGGLRITAVAVDGPAEAAGLMAGDVITRIAGVPVASRGSFYVATEEAFGKETFEVEYLRDGALQTAVFDKRKASQGTGTATAMKNSAPQSEASTRAPDAASTLDELEKLGDLRDRGILSEEEFETMKARILSAGPQPSDATPNPVVYGVEKGQPIASYTVLEELKNSRFEIAPPTSIPGLATLVVQGTPETGVCAVEMFGTTHKNDRRGRAVLMDYNRQRQELDNQFGLPSERDFLRANSEWDDADEYALSTWHGHRSRSSVWQLDGSNGIAAVYLSIFAHRPNDLYVKVSYDFSNYERCKSIIDARSAPSG